MEINPEWQRAYRSELANNMSVKSNDFTKQLFLIDIIEECVWYSCDMCLEYYRQGPFKGFLPNTIDDISFNVYTQTPESNKAEQEAQQQAQKTQELKNLFKLSPSEWFRGSKNALAQNSEEVLTYNLKQNPKNKIYLKNQNQ